MKVQVSRKELTHLVAGLRMLRAYQASDGDDGKLASDMAEAYSVVGDDEPRVYELNVLIADLERHSQGVR